MHIVMNIQMSKQNFIICVLVTCIISLLSACQSEKMKDGSIHAKLKADSLARIEQLIVDSLAQVQRAQNLKKLNILKKNFFYSEDKFKKIGWYVHKRLSPKGYSFSDTFISPGSDATGTYLVAHVRDNGECYLQSQYHSVSGWIFHTRISAMVGDKVTTSQDIPSYDNRNERDADGYGITEKIHFTGGTDNGILEALASSNGQTVTVRFEGNQKYDERTLTKTEIQAIKESVQLASLLK
jgi:hypothetical protein